MLDLLLSELEKTKKEDVENAQSLNDQYGKFLTDFKEYTESLKAASSKESEINEDYGRTYKS